MRHLSVHPEEPDSPLQQDPNAALALVSARPGETGNTKKLQTGNGNENDADLKRAKDLLELHTNVKLAHQDGTDRDRELSDARDAVNKVLRTL